MTPNFENTIDRIYLALKKDNLTKQEARDMRAALLGWNWKLLPLGIEMWSFCP